MILGRMHLILFSLLVLLIGCQKVQEKVQDKVEEQFQVPDYILSDTLPPIDETREAKMLSAFFGLDNALTQRARLIWKEAPGKDGMPIVFSHEIDPQTVDPSDFQVTTQKGDIRTVEFVSYKPAVEEFELRTLLLIGEYGEYPDNEPVAVEIIGELKTRDGQELKGQKMEVTPLEEGPFISYAEYFKIDDRYPYVEKGNGCDCPKAETQVVVRAVWSGGVRSKEGEEIGEAELNHFYVTLVHENDTIVVNPFLIADINDNENNIDLCIKEAGIPISVRAAANIAIDPRDDLNTITECKILSRW